MEILAELVPVDGWGELLDLFVCTLPRGKSAGEESASFLGEDENPAAAIVRVAGDLNQTAALERLECSSQSGAVHREQGSNRAHRRWFGTIERHEQRELSVGEVEGTEVFVEAARESTSCTLYVKAETSVFHHQRCFERQRFST